MSGKGYAKKIKGEKMIHIAICIHDPSGEYSSHAAATIASVYANTSQSVCIHILHDETLSQVNASKFKRLAQDYDQQISFVEVSLPGYCNAIDFGNFTCGSLYRLLIPEFLTIEKAIYLDCDIIVNLDISELWECSMGGHPVAAVRDQGIALWSMSSRKKVKDFNIDLNYYFNSGVMIMNLGMIRETHRLLDEWHDFEKQFPQSPSPDQDFLNKTFQHECYWLDERFNRFAFLENHSIEHIRLQRKIYHYCNSKPWIEYKGEVDFLYWHYFSLTPWRDTALVKIIKMMDNEITKMKRSKSWRMTKPFRWLAMKLRGQ